MTFFMQLLRPGEKLFEEKNCAGCHGAAAVGGVTAAPRLQAKKGPEVNAWDREWGGNGIPVKAPSATISSRLPG